jgi:hypothetical protein
MGTPRDITWGLDVYSIIAFPLNSDGSLQAVNTTPYEGVAFAGPKSFDVNYGTARAIANVSQGRVNDTIHLPSIDPKTGTIHCSYDMQSLNALLSGVTKGAVGEGTTVHYGTDKQGQEPLVGLLLSQLVTHDDDGLVVWKNYIVPRATVVPSPHAFTENALDKVYDITFSSAKRELWGENLSEAVHGCLQSTMTDMTTEGKLGIVAWLGDGAETAFLFPAAKTPISDAKLVVFNFVTGIEEPGVYAIDLYGIGSFTPTVMPILDELLVAVFEY